MNHHHRRKFTEGLLDIEHILDSLNVQPGQIIIDAGCGNGYMSLAFSKRITSTGKVFALDNDKYFMDALRKETQGTNIVTIVCDITGSIPIEKESADLIYISTLIYRLSRQGLNDFLCEVKRLLKSDGLLAIVEIEKKETSFGPPLNSRLSPEELKRIIPMHPLMTIQAGEHFYMQVFQNPLFSERPFPSSSSQI